MSGPTLNTLRLPLALLLLVVCAASAAADDNDPLWMRYPAVSPDGQTVVFAFRGDLFQVAATGGLATPLTIHEAHDSRPVWSPDGRWIAFASDRHGNFDTYLMPADGGQARRLTFHSAPDAPCGFTPDGGRVLFNSARLDAQLHVEYPNGALPELYSVPIDGGRPDQVLTVPALQATMDSDAKRLLYAERTGLEDSWRKHNRSSFTRNIWLVDLDTGTHERLTPLDIDDRDPVWAPDDESFYFLSERAGDFNIFEFDFAAPDQPRQLTRHEKHPVRFLSASNAGDLCYGFNGEIWLMRSGAKSGSRIPVIIRTEDPRQQIEYVTLSRGITEFDLSPTGKEIVFVNRGEIFVTSTEHDLTKRITNTPEQERSARFSPDGRSLIYAGERGGSWNLYRCDLALDDEPYFHGATLLKETAVLEIDAECFQPAWSPDGTEIAYLEERTTLKVVNLESGKTRAILPGDRNYSYADGDQWYDWSPDGKWFLANFLSTDRWSMEAGLVSADGDGDIVNLTRSGYEDNEPRWAMGGKVMLWHSDRNGMRDHGGWRTTGDLFGMFFDRKAWDRWHLSEAELALAKALEDDKKDGKNGKDGKEEDEKDDGKKDDGEEKKDERKYPDGFKPKKLPDPLELDLDDLEDRIARLTIHAASIADAVLTEDGEQLFYLARFEKGFDLWSYKHRENEVKLLAKLGARRAGGLVLDGKEKHVFVLADGGLKKIDLGKGSAKPVGFSATMELDAAAERAYLFEHAWRQIYKKFYDPKMHGVDWPAYKKAYARFLPWINNNDDFAEMLSEMLGELNASHTGAGYRPRPDGADATAGLGAFYDPEHEGDGLRILEVIDKGPLVKADAGLMAGMIIEAIDGVEIVAGRNWYPLLNRKAGKAVRLTVVDPDAKKDERTREIVVKPVSGRQMRGLLYDRWVERRRADTETLSDGRLGYVHVRSMNSGVFRDAFADILGRYSDKEGLVVDTRFNNGGNLTEFLADFLSGRQYARSAPRGQIIGREPSMSWSRPSIVIQNEGNYSDAHYFPWVYRELGIGKLVGTQVPGTATAVWWETLQDRTLYFGMPMVGVLDNRDQLLENQNLDPDHQIDNDPDVAPTGRDQQLEKAVEVLLADIDGR